MSQAQVLCHGPQLSEVQSKSLDYIVKEVPGALGVIALPNIEKIKDSTDLPSGTVICVAKTAQLDTSVLPSDLFSVLAVYPILKSKSNEEGKYFNDEYFRSRMNVDKGRSIEDSFGEGPSLKNAVLLGSAKRIGSDMAAWKPFLGKGFWSICKYEEEQYAGKYYIAVYVPRTKLSTEFLTKAKAIADEDALQEGPHSTFQDIFELPEYTVAQQLAHRNANKIAWKVATEFGVFIKHRTDSNAPVSSETLTQPMIALPTHQTMFNHLDLVSVKTNTRAGSRMIAAIAIYNGCGSINESVGGFLCPVSPRLGIDLYPNLHRVVMNVQNKSANAIPQGRSFEKTRELRQPELTFNQHHVYWYDKRGMAVHSKMRAVYNTDDDAEIQYFLPSGASEPKQRLSHVIEYLGRA